jgi:hyaluronate lyase
LTMFHRLLSLALLSIAPFVQADEYDDLRLKWKDIIIGVGYDTLDPDVASRLTSIASAGNTHWASMDKSPTRTFLWSDLASTTEDSHVTANYARLEDMARAYATPGSTLAGNATLLADIVSGLDWMYANRYGANTTQYDGWFDWEIGSPLKLNDICVMLYDHLTTTQLTNYMNAVDHQTPTPNATGANQVWKARVVGIRACLVKSSAKMALCRDAFSDVFPYVTTGDGYYTDGSFIQHERHPYTAGYGASLIENMAPVLNWLSGTTWAVTDPAQANLFRWVFDSYEPIIYNGYVFDLVSGREITRPNQGPDATSMMDSILQIAQFAPPADALRMKRMIKEWAQKDYTRNFATSRGLPTLQLAKSLMSDAGITPRGELLAHYTFQSMDRVIHLGAGHGFGLTMHSTRIFNFEGGRGENQRGWFAGDGQTTIYNGDLKAFHDAYHATVDHYRLPGVTADVTNIKPPSVLEDVTNYIAYGESTLSPHSWVGGATLGRFGAAGMQFKGYDVTLTGKKSWFMFDDEIVCLGAGITSTDSRPIETTVEQRKINSTGSNAFTVNGTAKPSTLGWTEAMSSTSWAHLSGHVTGSDIGYFFPTAPTIKALREARTGAWADVQVGGPTTPITRNYLRMSFEHGSNPKGATYQYVLLPGRTATRTGHYATAPHITVLTNNANVQAVRENTLGITAANFWTDSTFTSGGITSNKKASVLVREDGPFIDVSVSDPTQLNTAGIVLQIALDGGTLVSADAGVTVTQSSPSIAMTIATSGAAGKTFKARFYRLAPQTVSLSPVADSYVFDAAASVDSNFGNANNLIVKKGGAGFNRESYLRFDVPAGGGILLGATLKLYSLSVIASASHAVAKVDDTTWGETTITWNDQPTAVGTELSTWAPVVNTTSSTDVTAAMPASGLVSLKVYATTSVNDYVTYASRQNGTVANRPRLDLSYGHTPPEIALTAPADGSTGNAGPVTLSADAIATDGAITSVAFYDGETLLGTDTSAPYAITPSLSGGPHYLKATATDANGLTRTSLTTRIDNAYPPVANATALTTPIATPIDLDLRTLVSDVETPLTSLKLQLGTATNGIVTLLADGRTARFTPTAGYSGPASFSYTVIDTTRDARTLLNYAFQNNDVTDSSGQSRDATLNVQGTGTATFATDSPLAGYTQSIALTENSTEGAARLERSLLTSEVDLATDDWSITGWFKRNTTTNLDVIMQLGNTAGYGSTSLTLAFYGTNNTLSLRNYPNSSTQDIDLSKTSVLTGTWNHFAIVRSGSTISWYHNGVLVGSDSAFALAITNGQPVKFGGPGSLTALDRWLNGSLADLAVFDAALAPADITKLTTTPVQWLGGQTGTATVSIQVLSPIEQWRQQHFGNTTVPDTDDLDKDGTINLIEYATKMNPATNDVVPQSATMNGANLEYLYTKNKSATDVTYTVEWSDDLVSWSAAGVTSSVLTDGTTTQQIKALVPAGVAKRFVHLKVAR